MPSLYHNLFSFISVYPVPKSFPLGSAILYSKVSFIVLPWGKTISTIKNKLLYLYALVFLKLTNKLYSLIESGGFTLKLIIESLFHLLGTDLYSSKTRLESHDTNTEKTIKKNNRTLFCCIFTALRFSFIVFSSSVFVFIFTLTLVISGVFCSLSVFLIIFPSIVSTFFIPFWTIKTS